MLETSRKRREAALVQCSRFRKQVSNDPKVYLTGGKVEDICGSVSSVYAKSEAHRVRLGHDNKLPPLGELRNR